jgi:hypothetical protein
MFHRAGRLWGRRSAGLRRGVVRRYRYIARGRTGLGRSRRGRIERRVGMQSVYPVDTSVVPVHILDVFASYNLSVSKPTLLRVKGVISVEGCLISSLRTSVLRFGPEDVPMAADMSSSTSSLA